MFVKVTIQGVSSLLMHRFGDKAAAAVQKGGRKVHVGERSPPREEAEGFAYRLPSGQLYVPGPGMFRAIVDAGRFHKNGRNKLTTGKFSLVPSALWMAPEFAVAIPLHDADGKPIKDFEIDSRRIVTTTGGAQICHRPIIHRWCASFALDVDEDFFDEKLVRLLVDDAGKKIGVGSYRPERKGPYGRFVVKEWMVEIRPATAVA